jgi:hypothetical protein
VTGGTTCIDNATITGNVHVTNGASVVLSHAQVSGSLNADGAMSVEIIHSSITIANVARTSRSLIVFGSTFTKGLVLDENHTTQKATVVGNKGSISEVFK